MTILIDADGCPVVDLTVQTAAKYKVPVLILCDTAHQIQRDGAQKRKEAEVELGKIEGELKQKLMELHQ